MVQLFEMTTKKEQDRIRLREAFYRAFDSGRLSHAAQRLASSGAFSGFESVGAGMHFRCFAETPNRQGGAAPMRLVIKIASGEFLAEVGNLEAWTAGLRRIAATDLVPPFEVLHTKQAAGRLSEVFALVMPYGPDTAERCSDWWQQPVKDLLRGFYENIARNNLHLGDVPQMRCWDGIPFIVDFSDLRPAGRV